MLSFKLKEEKRSWLRPLCLALWVLVGILFYQNHMLQTALRRMEQAPFGAPSDEADLWMELRTLGSLNKTYEADLKREHINLKECMSKLPKSEVDDFYKRHQEELQQLQVPK